MEPHKWMIEPTRQTEWIDKRGLFLWLALYTGGLGGGLYLVSLYFNNLSGMIISWLIVAVLKGGFHLMFLGKPWRCWRILSRPQSSWLARGFILVVSFVGFGAIQIIVSILFPGTIWEIVFKILSGVMAFGVATYTGFVLNNVKSVPFWNSSLLPILFFVCGISGGFGLIMLLAKHTNNIDISMVESGSRWLLLIYILLVAMYITIALLKGSTGKQSVFELMRGNSSSFFWIGVIIIGVIIPLSAAFSGYFHYELSILFLLMGVICEIIGGMALRYCILRVGIYQPLLP